MIHELKIDPVYFKDVQCGDKTFEVRRADRPFAVGDFLALNECTEHGYTGICMLARVSYILKDARYCRDGFWILGITDCHVIGKDGSEGARS
jgi:hypothetical protein